MDNIVFEERTENTHSIIYKDNNYMHIVSETNPKELSSSANTLKILLRNSNFDNFTYDLVFYTLTKILNCTNTTFKVFLFEETENLAILKELINFLNRSYGSRISFESDETHYIIRNENEIIFQSFF